jgi:hypothetical protein
MNGLGFLVQHVDHPRPSMTGPLNVGKEVGDATSLELEQLNGPHSDLEAELAVPAHRPRSRP